MIADMMATTIKPAGPTIEPGSRPELYVGVDVPAKVDGRVITESNDILFTVEREFTERP